jgi:hypothetical protein
MAPRFPSRVTMHWVFSTLGATWIGPNVTVKDCGVALLPPSLAGPVGGLVLGEPHAIVRVALRSTKASVFMGV